MLSAESKQNSGISDHWKSRNYLDFLVDPHGETSTLVLDIAISELRGLGCTCVSNQMQPAPSLQHVVQHVHSVSSQSLQNSFKSNWQTEAGMGPIRSFSSAYSSCKFLRLDSSEGIVPERRFL